MSRQGQSMAQSTYNQGKNFGSTSSTNSKDLYGQLFPEFSSMATNPQGFGPADLAKMNTASQQSTGGATAAAKGEGDLVAARTRNSAGIAPAIDESAREGMRRNSDNALSIEGANATLKQRQAAEGRSGMESLYGTNTRDVLGSIGLENKSAEDYAEAGKSGWFQNVLGLANTVGNLRRAFSPGSQGGGSNG